MSRSTWGCILLAVLAAGCAEPAVEYRGKNARQWLDELDSKERQRHDAAIAALVCLGDAALPALMDALDDEDGEIRRGAACALVEIDASHVATVKKAFDQGDLRAQLTLARAMFRKNVEGHAAVGAVLDGLSDPDSGIRHQAVQALADLHGDSSSAVFPLAEALKLSSA
jgi:HEAT repeat protein